MIICRKCTTNYTNDDVHVCTSCGADLDGPDGIRPAGALRRDFDVSSTPIAGPSDEEFFEQVRREAIEPPPEVDPVDGSARPVSPTEPPTPSPIREPGRPLAEPVITPFPSSSPLSSPSSSGSAARRGRKPGEGRSESEEEPESNAPVQQQAQSKAPIAAPRKEGLREEAVAPGEPSIGPPDAASAGPASAASGRRVPRASGSGTLQEAEVACGSCNRPNGNTLRWCRYCGETLPAYVPGEDEEDVEHSDSIWRRLMGTTKSGNFDNRTQAQRMRDKGVKRLKYRAKYTLKSRLRAFGVVGLGAGSLLMMFGPYRARIKEFVVPPDPIPVAQVMLGETPPLEQGRFGERFASDNKSDTALVFVWDDENPQPISFTVDLTGSKNVKKLVFETGFPNDNEFGPLIKRPERLTLSAGGEIQEVVLADFEGPQRVAFDLPKDTRQIEVTIETVHDRNWDTYDRVAIAEIAVVR